ncbi:hypothetical protein ACFL9U_17080 [Thermodesulfobacteriota bacterium]
MQLIGGLALGIVLFISLALEGLVMLVCTKRFMQIKPEGKGTTMAVNCWNTLILLLFIPLIAVLLVSGHYNNLDVTRLKIDIPAGRVKRSGLKRIKRCNYRKLKTEPSRHNIF